MCRVVFFYYILWSTANLVLIHTTNHFVLDPNQCVDICSDSFFLLPKERDSQEECQRGCRFLSIIALTAKGSLNDTKGDCYESCSQSYTIEHSRKSCVIGCDAMGMKKESELHYILPYLNQYNINDQEFESIENDFFLDPLIRQQIQQSYDGKYKIPEAYIRTLPIGDGFNLITGISYRYYKNNPACSSLISFAIFGAVLIGFLICIVKIIQSMQAIESRIQFLTYSDVKEITELVRSNNANDANSINEKVDDNLCTILVTKKLNTF